MRERESNLIGPSCRADREAPVDFHQLDKFFHITRGILYDQLALALAEPVADLDDPPA